MSCYLLVVTGLPVTYFGSQHEQLQRALKKETSVQIDGNLLLLQWKML